MKKDTLKSTLQLVKDSADANISTLGSILMKVFAAPDLFCGYDEIKPILQPKLSGPEGEKILKTIDLFSYGVYQDYVKDTQSFMSLSNPQIFKLRQLTVLTLVQNACTEKKDAIPYSEFQPALGLEDLRAIEEVLMSCIYEQVVSGKLCQKSQSILLSSRFGPTLQSRDVPMTQIPQMIAVLRNLHNRIEGSITHVKALQEKTIQEAEAAARKAKEDEEKLKETPQPGVAEGIEAVGRRQKRSRGGAVAGAIDVLQGRAQR